MESKLIKSKMIKKSMLMMMKSKKRCYNQIHLHRKPLEEEEINAKDNTNENNDVDTSKDTQINNEGNERNDSFQEGQELTM